MIARAIPLRGLAGVMDPLVLGGVFGALVLAAVAVVFVAVAQFLPGFEATLRDVAENVGPGAIAGGLGALASAKTGAPPAPTRDPNAPPWYKPGMSAKEAHQASRDYYKDIRRGLKPPRSSEDVYRGIEWGLRNLPHSRVEPLPEGHTDLPIRG